MTPPDNNLETEVAALRNQVFTLLVALIVVSGTLTVFLYRQASVTGKDIVQDQQLAVLLDKNKVTVESFVQRLVTYSQKHPDFAPILKKYGIVPTPAGAPAAPTR
jgi:hypothetical protein